MRPKCLLALVALHLRITVPGLFALGIIRTYWMLIVMVVAFCGAGLSVLFHRRTDAHSLGAAGTDGPAAADLAADGLLVPQELRQRGDCGSWAIPARPSGC